MHILKSALIKAAEVDGKGHIQGKWSSWFAWRIHVANAQEEHKKILPKTKLVLKTKHGFCII